MSRGRVDILDRSLPARTVIMSIVWPCLIEEFMMILVGFVDTAMVGSVGVNATASVALGSPIMMLTNGFMMGLSMGFSVLVGRSIGEGRKDEGLRIMRQTVYLVLVFGVFMNLLYAFFFTPYLPQLMRAKPEIWESSSSYLFHIGWSRIFIIGSFTANAIHRSQGDTHTAMVANVSANICNCVLNFLFIYPTRTLTVLGMSFTMIGWGKGVTGAAIATSIANIVSFVISFSKLFDKKKEIPLSFDGFPKFEPHVYASVFRLGIPVALERAIISFGQIIITSMLADVGTSTLAAHNLAGNAESVCFISVMGFGTAATTLVAQWLGAGDHERAEELATKCIKYSITVMGCVAFILYFICPYVIDVFTNDRSVIDMGSEALRIQCFAEVFSAATMCISGILRGAGDVRYSTFSSIVGMWVVRIPLAIVLVRVIGLGLNGVWIPMAVDWVVRCALMTYRYRSGKWKHAFEARRG